MKKIRLLLLFVACSGMAQDVEKQNIATTLDGWHAAAAAADFNSFFGMMSEDAAFIGTDATENWNLKEFKAYSKPHFDKGKAWTFKSVQRSIFLSSDGDMAWFDELLDTQMKLCRGSGVLVKTNGTWKIAHYVLSIAVPNEHVAALIDLKKDKDNSVLEELLRQ